MSAFPIEIINYRNAIYQGHFNHQLLHRQGFGIVFNASSKEFIVSTFSNNQPNNHTLILTGLGQYMYGTWLQGLPDGYFVMRICHTVIFGQYIIGVLQDKFVVVVEDENIVVTVQKNYKNEFEVIKRGQLFQLSSFSHYLSQQCGMEDFPSNYSTLVQYVSEYIISKGCMIRLTDNGDYRLGYEKGLSIIFNDSYDIYSMGQMHHDDLKQIGVSYRNQSVFQGNWMQPDKLICYKINQTRPWKKIESIYCLHNLKSLKFVNEFFCSFSNLFLSEMQIWIESDRGRMVLAGLITSRRRNSPVKEYLKAAQKLISNQSKSKPSQDNKISIKRLQEIKKQIQQEVMRKKIANQIQQLALLQQTKRQNRKLVAPILPIGHFVNHSKDRIKSNHIQSNKIQSNSIQSNKITPDSSRSIIRQRSFQDTIQIKQLSPFGERINSRIFKNHKNNMKQRNNSYSQSPLKDKSNSKVRKPIFENIQIKDLRNNSGKVNTNIELNKNNIDMKNYESPHQNINLSVSKINNFDSSLSAYPLTIQKNRKNKIDSNQLQRLEIKPEFNYSKKVINQPNIILSASKRHFDKIQRQQLPNNSVYLKPKRERQVQIIESKIVKNNELEAKTINNSLTKRRMTYEPIVEHRQVKYREQYHKREDYMKRQQGSGNKKESVNQKNGTPKKRVGQNTIDGRAKKRVGQNKINVDELNRQNGRGSYRYYFKNI